MRVMDAMSVPAFTVTPGTGGREVARTMLDCGVSAFPVVDGDGAVLGVVSEADVLSAHLTTTPPTAGDLMTSPAITVDPEASLEEAAGLMHRYAVKRLPVVDRRGRVVGIVTRMDVLRALFEEADAMPPDVRRMVRARRRETTPK
jgi:CBS domain-containing protein